MDDFKIVSATEAHRIRMSMSARDWLTAQKMATGSAIAAVPMAGALVGLFLKGEVA